MFPSEITTRNNSLKTLIVFEFRFLGLKISTKLTPSLNHSRVVLVLAPPPPSPVTFNLEVPPLGLTFDLNWFLISRNFVKSQTDVANLWLDLLPDFSLFLLARPV